MNINKSLFSAIFTVVAMAISGNAMAKQAQGNETRYTSPSGVIEKCIAVKPMPGGKYSASDKKHERKYCSINFYDKNTALCPKIWSTSPGTIVYDLSPGSYAGKVKHFEQTACKRGKGAKKLPVKKLAKFKSTMNTPETSGTFSTSSLLYYHFSRYFDTVVGVPVAVWRSIDRKNHLQRVTKKGVAYSSRSRMLHAGWLTMEHSEQNPAFYHPEYELFTPDARAIYGVLLNSPGHRYNSSINGTRASGWGAGQNNDFQKTAPYQALRSAKPLPQAIKTGLHLARRNSKMNRDLGKNVSDAQMVFWMTELTEITLLDFIFNQQDRIGNIDFIPYWFWLENGKVHHQKASGHKAPAQLAGKKLFYIKRSQINDNDAGGKLSYINFTKKTKMLEKQRHFRAITYQQLLRLNQDFLSKGRLYQYLSNTFGLTNKQLRHIVKNTADATAILQKNCRAGKLRFDLDPEEFLRKGATTEHKISCG